MIPLATVFTVGAKLAGHLAAAIAAAEAYQRKRDELRAQYPQAVNDFPDLSAVIAEGHERIDAWEGEINAREAKFQRMVDAQQADPPTRLDA